MKSTKKTSNGSGAGSLKPTGTNRPNPKEIGKKTKPAKTPGKAHGGAQKPSCQLP